ncbi:hypothetical protein ACKAV7_008394 [Fusarium commune]
MAHSAEKVDVVVVGAGLSGFQCAVDLHRAGLTCIVLEALDRVGGKTLSIDASSTGGKVDLGAAWLNDTNQSRMYALAKKYEFDLIKQRDEGLNILEAGDGSTISYKYGTMPQVGTKEDQVQFLTVLEKFQGLIDQSDLEHPHHGPDAKQLDSITAREYFDSVTSSELIRDAAGQLTCSLLGAEATEMSLLFLLNYIKSGTGLANITSDLKDGGQYLRSRQGRIRPPPPSPAVGRCVVFVLLTEFTNPKQAVSLSANVSHPSSRPGAVRLSSAVKRIEQSRDGFCAVTTAESVLTARKVVVSIPTPLYPSIEFSPPLPPAKQQLATSTALGYWSKTIFGPAETSRDTSIEADRQFSITVFIVGDMGRRWSKFSASEDAGSGSAVEIPAPINVIEKEWSKEPWFWGAPSPFMLPGVLTSDTGRSIRDSFGDVHFVGTELAVVWKGYMEGAVRAGEAGAAEVVQSLKQTKG